MTLQELLDKLSVAKSEYDEVMGRYNAKLSSAKHRHGILLSNGYNQSLCPFTFPNRAPLTADGVSCCPPQHCSLALTLYNSDIAELSILQPELDSKKSNLDAAQIELDNFKATLPAEMPQENKKESIFTKRNLVIGALIILVLILILPSGE